MVQFECPSHWTPVSHQLMGVSGVSCFLIITNDSNDIAERHKIKVARFRIKRAISSPRNLLRNERYRNLLALQSKQVVVNWHDLLINININK